jgi:hypothetical protein
MQMERVALVGRLRSLAIGSFREAQLQGLPFGDEPGKVAGMSRPIAVRRRAPKLPDDRPGYFTFRIDEAAVRGLQRSATSRHTIGQKTAAPTAGLEVPPS